MSRKRAAVLISGRGSNMAALIEAAAAADYPAEIALVVANHADAPGRRIAEAAGIADFDLSLWQGIFTPRGTPADVVARLNTEINKIITQPDVRARLRDEGADVAPLSVEQTTAFVQKESAKYLHIIRQSGVKPN